MNFQVGVCSKAVTSADIFNIQPLNVEKTQSGYLRYTSGRFNNSQEAENYRQVIIVKGVTDAFVTAYSNGVRISLDKAEILLATTPPVRDEVSRPKDEEKPIEILIEDKKEPSVPVKEEPIIEEKRSINNIKPEDLHYVVFLGSYENQIPNEVAAALLEYSEVGIKKAINQGKYIYSTREIKNIGDAESWLNKFRASGIKNARIIYVVNGNKISLEQAKEILNK